MCFKLAWELNFNSSKSLVFLPGEKTAVFEILSQLKIIFLGMKKSHDANDFGKP